MTTQVQTVNQAAIHKLAAEIAVQTNGKDNLTEFKKAAKDVLICCEQLQKQAKEHKAAEEKTVPSSTPTTPPSDPIPSVTTAELRRALAKLVAAYIKSTGETGRVLFGSGKNNTGIVGAEMTMGFSSANEAKSAMESQATGMIVSGCFSIAAGCMAVGGGAMGAGAAGEAASSLTELNAAPEIEGTAEPTTAATGEASTTGSDTVTVADEIEMTPITRSTPDSADASNASRTESVEARLAERPTTDTDSSTGTDSTDEPVEGRVEQSERTYTKEQKEQEREQIRLKKEGKQSKAQALTMGTGLAQGSGSITQSHFTQQQATEDQASKTLQTAAQAVNTSTQTAQKFYGDIQSGVQAVAQTMDLVNQTVVASSRV